MSEWLYATGLGLLIASYRDSLGFMGANRLVSDSFQIVFGTSFLVLYVWGFFVFDWWVPLFYWMATYAATRTAQMFVFGGGGLNSIIVGVGGFWLSVANLIG